MEKKAFFFDIDETLLSWITHEVPASAIYALEELKKKGHLTFINSGRMFSTGYGKKITGNRIYLWMWYTDYQ